MTKTTPEITGEQAPKRVSGQSPEQAQEQGMDYENTRELAEKPVSRLLLSYSAPAIIGLLALAAYETIDAIFVGQFVGDKGLAAVMLGFPFFMLLHACCNIIRVGGTSLVSRLLGQADPQGAARALGSAFTGLLLFGVLVAVLGNILVNPILVLCGMTPDVAQDATAYARVIVGGAPALFLLFGLSSFLRATGYPRKALYIILISCAGNVALDALFVGLFSWGVPGAALATVISQFLGAIYGLAHFFNKSTPLRLSLPNLCPDFAFLKEIASVGFAYSALEMTLMITMVLSLRMLSIYGDSSSLAANLIVESCIAFLYLPLTGVDEGLQPVLGYNYGANNKKRSRAVIVQALGASSAFLIVSLLVIMGGAEIIVSFFVDDNPAFMVSAARALRIVFCLAPLAAAMLVIPAILSALGEVKNNLVLTLAPQFLGQIPALIILPRFLGVDGVWLSFPIYDAFAALLGIFLLVKTMKKLNI